MSRTKALLATGILVLVSIGLAVTTSGLLSSQNIVPTSGTMSSSIGVEVYIDPAATELCTYIDWGTVEEDEVISQTIYVKNTGNVTETLNMIITDWEPVLAGELLTVTWNREGTQLEPDSVVAATLTLMTPHHAGSLDNFSFNVVIKGTT